MCNEIIEAMPVVEKQVGKMAKCVVKGLCG